MHEFISPTSIFNPRFSHIYVEKRALGQPLANRIISKFPNSRIIEVNHYKDIFCRPRQDFLIQKRFQKLILGFQGQPYLYKRAKPCHTLGHDRFFYVSEILNCLFDCEYCFLQGMYPSGNIVIFVNREDVFSALDKELEHGPFMLSISYNTDLLPFEKLTGMVEAWIDYAAKHPYITIELRTKSAITFPFSKRQAVENFQISWSLSPDDSINAFEQRTPAAGARLKAMKKVASEGWKVRLCFDPVIPYPGWKQGYKSLMDNIFNEVDEKNIIDITIGPFRMAKEHLKRARRLRPRSALLAYPYVLNSGIYEFPAQVAAEIVETLSKYASCFLESGRIHAAVAG